MSETAFHRRASRACSSKLLLQVRACLIVLAVILSSGMILQAHFYSLEPSSAQMALQSPIQHVLPLLRSSNARLSSSNRQSDTSSHKKDNAGMAACLMVRDDNALLSEWLAYHYIVLPLRHVLVAADLGSTQDPRDVLQRYNSDTHTDNLQYTVWNHSQFLTRFGDIPVDRWEDENHHYIHRQRAFLTSCAEYMRATNQTWVAFVDTDEYLVLNRATEEELVALQEEVAADELAQHNTSRHVRLEQRLLVNLQPKRTTVRQALDEAERIETLSPCQVVPRLLFGSLENETCTNIQAVKYKLDASALNYSELSTLRFVQHAKKGAFYPSKWGKVLVDVSRLALESLQIKPKNAHRPFPECPKPLAEFDESMVHVHHYLGSWERYSARQDVRRSRAAFEERAYFSHGTSCDYNMHGWVEELMDLVGVSRARYLLTGI